MSKFNAQLPKLAALCRRHKFLIERSVETTQGTKSVYDYGILGAIMRRNLKNLWWQDVTTSRETVRELELSMFNTIEISGEFLPQNSHRIVDTGKLFEKIDSFLLENNSRESKDISGHLRNVILENSLPLRTATPSRLDDLVSFNEEHPALPSGYAWHSKKVTMETNEDNLLRNLESDHIFLKFLCEVKSTKHWFNFWRRQRITWWRKFANDPANFLSLDDGALRAEKDSMTKTQYKFSWDNETIETIICQSNDKDPKELMSDKHSSLLIDTNIDKGFISLLADAFEEKELPDSTGNVSVKEVLHLHPSLAPYKVAIHTSLEDYTDLVKVSHQLATELRQAGISTNCKSQGLTTDQFYSIQDEIGTPYCITMLQSTLNNGIVELRNRNTSLQEVIHISDVLKTVQTHLQF